MGTEVAAFAGGADRLPGRGTAAIVACLTVLVATVAVGQSARRKPAEVRRSAPPQGKWDRVTADSFSADAFSTLTGERPDFTGTARGTTSPVVGGPPGPAAEAAGSGFKWSTLISEGTLTDEIKDMRTVLVEACAKPTDFKGGGFEQARVAFSSVALAFGVIAAYDQQVRWKKDATTARDLFARAGFNCKVGTDQSFAESKVRLDDLAAMLDGNPPAGRPDRDEDFRWSQVAGRPALMKRLEDAQNVIRPAIASQAEFAGKRDELAHALEIVAAIGEVIRQPDYEYHDDESYLEIAAAMRDAAAEARAACEKKDHDAARAAVGRLEKACDDCHGGYRS